MHRMVCYKRSGGEVYRRERLGGEKNGNNKKLFRNHVPEFT